MGSFELDNHVLQDFDIIDILGISVGFQVIVEHWQGFVSKLGV